MSVFKLSANHVNQPSYEAAPQASSTWDGEYAYSPELYQREETDHALTQWRDYQDLESGDQGLTLDPDDALDDLGEMEEELGSLDEDVGEDFSASPAETAQIQNQIAKLSRNLSQLKLKIQMSNLEPEIKAMLLADVTDLNQALHETEELPDAESLTVEVEALGKDFEEALKERSIALANEKAEKAYEEAQKAKEEKKDDKSEEEGLEPVTGGY